MKELSLRPLIVCADDYGISPGVSRGIRELAEAGRISATGAMTCMPHWPEAAAAITHLAGRVAVGLHLTLTDQGPLGPMPKLAPTGRFPGIAHLNLHARLGGLPMGEIAAELDRQLDAFEAQFGRPPDFIDGHQHVHLLPGIRDLVIDACVERLAAHGTWLRDTWDRPIVLVRRASLQGAMIALLGHRLHRGIRRRGVEANRGFAGVYPFGQIPLDAAIPRLLTHAGERPMLMVHPGHPDPGLAAVDSWIEPREGEWAYLMSTAFSRQLTELGFRVASGVPFPG
jgi:predicted glycoside hydrolase/deacetylase ChbG (UPF0249 family)